MNTVKRAWLTFARARPDFMFSLPPHHIVALLQEPLPYEESKVGHARCRLISVDVCTPRH